MDNQIIRKLADLQLACAQCALEATKTSPAMSKTFQGAMHIRHELEVLLQTHQRRDPAFVSAEALISTQVGDTHPRLFLLTDADGYGYLAYAPVEFVSKHYPGVGLFVIAGLTVDESRELTSFKPGVLNQVYSRVESLRFFYLSECEHEAGPNGEWWEHKFEPVIYQGRSFQTGPGDDDFVLVDNEAQLRDLFIQFKMQWLPSPEAHIEPLSTSNWVLHDNT